jgi:hypothetical protein
MVNATDDAKFLNAMDEIEAAKCPKCPAFIEKIAACNHMKHKNCPGKSGGICHFCYVCSEQITKKMVPIDATNTLYSRWVGNSGKNHYPNGVYKACNSKKPEFLKAHLSQQSQTACPKNSESKIKTPKSSKSKIKPTLKHCWCCSAVFISKRLLYQHLSLVHRDTTPIIASRSRLVENRVHAATLAESKNQTKNNKKKTKKKRCIIM